MSSVHDLVRFRFCEGKLSARNTEQTYAMPCAWDGKTERLWLRPFWSAIPISNRGTPRRYDFIFISGCAPFGPVRPSVWPEGSGQGAASDSIRSVPIRSDPFRSGLAALAFRWSPAVVRWKNPPENATLRRAYVRASQKRRRRGRGRARLGTCVGRKLEVTEASRLL